MELVTGASGRPYSRGITPSLSSSPKGEDAPKGGSAMAQQSQQQAQANTVQQAAVQVVPIRELTLEELVARAIYRKMQLEKKGKTSRRVVLSLSPKEVPPKSGTYATALGDIRIFVKFEPEKGRWLAEIKFPPTSGFQFKDAVQGPSNT